MSVIRTCAAIVLAVGATTCVFAQPDATDAWYAFDRRRA